MRSRYKILDQNQVYFVTSTILDWIPVFTESKYFDILVEAFRFHQENSSLSIYAYVFLDNHFHVILSADDISAVMQSVKRYTAKRIIKELKDDNKEEVLNRLKNNKKSYKQESAFQVWQEGYHPKLINDSNVLVQKIDYIHNNPVRKGLVEVITEWEYSSARDYWDDKEGRIKITKIG